MSKESDRKSRVERKRRAKLDKTNPKPIPDTQHSATPHMPDGHSSAQATDIGPDTAAHEQPLPQRPMGRVEAFIERRGIRDGIGLLMTAVGAAVSFDYFYVQALLWIACAIITVDFVGQLIPLRLRGRRATLAAQGVAAVLLIVSLGYYLPQRYGSYKSRHITGELRARPGPKGKFPEIYVGDTMGRLTWKDSPSSTGTDGQMWIGFEDAGIVVARVKGDIFLTGDIRGKDGNHIVAINKNKWYVNQSEVLDKNYTDDSLEVFDKRGVIVLQVRLSSERIRLQGEWWSASGTGCRLVANPENNTEAVMIRMGREKPNTFPFVRAVFRYPSSEHWGELLPSSSN